jgi:histidinol-phosphate aminotransferase
MAVADSMDQPFTPLVGSLPSSVPFVGPEAMERRRGVAFRARIGANESVFGPSPKVIAAIQEAAAQVWKYCDPENHDLKAALARHLGVAPENIAVGEGIDGLFGYAVRLFVEPGVAVVTSLGAYPTFNFHVHGHGGRLVTTPYVNDHEDLQSLLDLARREKSRLIYLANPDNPMGSWWGAAAIEDMIANLPPGALLMLDEAYGEFAPAGTLPALDVENPRVLRFRTFSKAYGLAGLRLGYAIGHVDVIKAFDRIRNHFGVTRLGQVAGRAALSDQDHLAKVVSQVEAARTAIAAIAQDNGLHPLASAANFVAIDCGQDGDHARRVLEALLSRGIFVRMPGVAPLDRCIRVTAGTDADLAILAKELPAAIMSAG